MEDGGWIRLYRKLLKNPMMEDPDYLAVWINLLLRAGYSESYYMFNGKKLTLAPGEFITGRKKLSKTTGVSESKIYRILRYYESEQQILVKSNNRFSRITIVNWIEYQSIGTTELEDNEQQMNNQRTTSEQPVNTIKKYKKVKKEKNNIPYDEILSYLNTKAGTGFKRVDSNTNWIDIRWKEKYTVDDFKKVIDIKCSEWKTDNKMNKFLRPSTLFGDNFDSYLNERQTVEDKQYKPKEYDRSKDGDVR